MPNHITTIVKAPQQVIDFLITDNRVDFNNVIPSFKDGQGNGIRGDVELCAESCLPFDSSQFLAGHKQSRMLESDITTLDNDSFEKFIQMLRNKRDHGYLHCMDFNREEWGTKWNAYDCAVMDGGVQFDTAWSFPKPVMIELSKKFPEQVLTIKYADEDTGSNCGSMDILNGEVVKEDIAVGWNEQTKEEKIKWCKFAFHIKHGEDAKPADYELDENYQYVED